MQPLNRKFYSFRADANALGGYLEAPCQKCIPTLAPVSLPAVGGVAMARSEAFTLDEIVRISSAYTRVSGRQHADGSASILITAAVEGVNILEVVTARRVVGQVSILVPEKGPLQISLIGSRFEKIDAQSLSRPYDMRRIHVVPAQLGKRCLANGVLGQHRHEYRIESEVGQ